MGQKYKKSRKKRKWWVRPINTRRKLCGEYYKLFQELKSDEEQFFVYTRMTPNQFQQLLDILQEHLRKHSIREPLNPEQRLAMTLRYLCHGGSMQSLAWNYRVGKSTVSLVIRQTCAVMWKILSPLYLKEPTEEDFQIIAQHFWQKWNFPNCCGAIDGKHILMQCPKKTGSDYFNYKGTFSIVLLAICDADYNFRLVDIGAQGSSSDSGILSQSNFGKKLLNNLLQLPQPATLPGSNTCLPYAIVGDQAFPLRSNLMRPFPERSANDEPSKIFNYRLSRARRTIENTFGIMASRFRIFRSTIIADVSTVEKIVAATVCLHNFIKMTDQNNNLYCPQNYADHIDENGVVVEGEWRQETNALVNISPQGSNNYSVGVARQRQALAQYFLTPVGELHHQYQHIRRGVLQQ